MKHLARALETSRTFVAAHASLAPAGRLLRAIRKRVAGYARGVIARFIYRYATPRRVSITLGEITRAESAGTLAREERIGESPEDNARHSSAQERFDCSSAAGVFLPSTVGSELPARAEVSTRVRRRNPEARGEGKTGRERESIEIRRPRSTGYEENRRGRSRDPNASTIYFYNVISSML